MELARLEVSVAVPHDQARVLALPLIQQRVITYEFFVERAYLINAVWN